MIAREGAAIEDVLRRLMLLAHAHGMVESGRLDVNAPATSRPVRKVAARARHGSRALPQERLGTE
ncbi:hypothetical protein WME98_03465 [Sorangium sp. So ce296]|uniref:hypothetical protein n=1 Tax=Sorangium sp. So ce296 TaxID=3133296 RepID=UPI003F626A7F